MSIEGSRESTNISRRVFLGGAAAVTAVGAAALLSRGEPGKGTSDERHPAEARSPHEGPGSSSEDFLVVKEKHFREYDMGRLAGVRLYDLFAAYTIGEERQVDHFEKIDFRYQLALLWQEKLGFVKRNAPEDYPRVLAAAKKEYLSYDALRAHPMAIEAYEHEAGRAVHGVRDAARMNNIKRIAAFGHFGAAQLELLHALDHRIDGRTLIAYALTELMPTGPHDAKLGVDLLDFLLRHAGEDFIDRIPAVYDSRISVGPYQFTYEALREVLQMQRVILEQGYEGVPESVLGLEGKNEHEAAYLFALSNLAEGMRELGEWRCEALLKHAHALPHELVAEYVAAAHHQPVGARKALRAFTDEFLRVRRAHGKQPHGREADFLAYCNAYGVGAYCGKTRANLAALNER